MAAMKQTVRLKNTIGLRSWIASLVQPYTRLVRIVTAFVTVGYVLTCVTEYRPRLLSHRFM
jgi:hypothetical protein